LVEESHTKMCKRGMKERSRKKVGEKEVRKEEDKWVEKVCTRNWSFKIICES